MLVLRKFLIILTILINLYCIHAIGIKKNFEFKVSAIHDLLKNDNWNCTDVVDFFIHRTARFDKKLNAILAINPKAFEQAVALDDYYHSNKRFKGKLHCIPIAIKDNIDVLGMPTTGGIRPLRNSFPNKSALVVDRLLNEGAIIISKTNLGELASGKDDSELAGVCQNPFDPKVSCGPSSIGSGAAIAAGLAVIALGTDTDGSIQCPGSFNGLFALRPPQGIPSVDGIIPSFARQDTVGPFSKYMDDLSLTYSIITGDNNIHDEYLKSIDNSKLRVGFFTNFTNNFTASDPTGTLTINHWMDPSVKEQTDKTIQKLKDLNIKVYEYSLNYEQLFQVLLLFKLTNDEAGVCMSACKKQSFDSYFGDVTRYLSDSPIKSFNDLFKSPFLSNYWLEDFIPSNVNNPVEHCAAKCASFDDYYGQFRNLISKWYETDNLDSIILPTRIQLPYEVGKPLPDTIPGFLSFSALSGYPSLNFPVGYSPSTTSAPDGLPIGMILISKPDRLINSFKIARAFEKSYSVVKLPSSTPLLENSIRNQTNSISFNQNILIILNLICLLIKKIF